MEINCICVTVIADSMLTASWLSICSNAIPVAAGLRMKHNGTVFSVTLILMLTIICTFVYTNLQLQNLEPCLYDAGSSFIYQ